MTDDEFKEAYRSLSRIGKIIVWRHIQNLKHDKSEKERKQLEIRKVRTH